jgi:AmiR/NasT family two-component response regulator
MEMVQSLIMMISKISSEVQELRIENETMKTQLRERQQVSPRSNLLLGIH